MDLREILCDLVNRCVVEINDGDDIKKPIKDKILKPLINYILEQIYPYLIVSVIIFALTLLVAIIILVLIIKSSSGGNGGVSNISGGIGGINVGGWFDFRFEILSCYWVVTLILDACAGVKPSLFNTKLTIYWSSLPQLV